MSIFYWDDRQVGRIVYTSYKKYIFNRCFDNGITRRNFRRKWKSKSKKKLRTPEYKEMIVIANTPGVVKNDNILIQGSRVGNHEYGSTDQDILIYYSKPKYR